MTIKIITDSGANLTTPTINGIDHVTVPLTLTVSGNHYVDDTNLDLPSFQAALFSSKEKTVGLPQHRGMDPSLRWRRRNIRHYHYRSPVRFL